MNKTLSMFVMLMFLLSTVSVFAQDTTDAITGDATEAIPAVTNAEEAAVASDAPVETAEAIPIGPGIADTAVIEDTTVTTVQVGKEYSTIDSVLDRIRLAFTFQEERKLELMNTIEQRRTQHYSFLVSKGKTEQAEKFKEKTIGLEKNFEQWKTNRAEKLAKMEANAAEAKEKGAKGQEKAAEKLTEKAGQIEQRVQEKTAEMEKKAAEVDAKLTERESEMEQRIQDRASKPVETEDSNDNSAENQTEED